ncbi:MAG: hypothetical protein V4450_01890 [Bacteroidota bacterium]
MKQKFSSPKEIEQILQSLDGIRSAEMPSFFYTRLQTKLDNGSAANSFWKIITQPTVSLVTLSLLLIVNVVAVRSYLKSSEQGQSKQNSGIENFVQEYDLSSTSIYNDKTERP